MKKTRLDAMQEQLLGRLPPDQGTRITAAMADGYRALCADYAQRPQALQRHLRNNILPVVAAFRALLDQGMSREEAAQLAGSCFLELMEAPANAIRRAMSIPGLYRLMPWLWKTLMPKLFSPDAGFRFRFHPCAPGQVRFDMVACPYLQACRELDCPELADIFCTTDDICYGHMHPKLIWNRTKTLARGGELCDFDLYIPRK